MAWVLLTLAGLLEVVWAIGLKRSEGFTHLWPSIWTLGAMGMSFWLLSVALRSLPLGTAYPVWVGIGARRDGGRGELAVRRTGDGAATHERCTHHRRDRRTQADHTGSDLIAR